MDLFAEVNSCNARHKLIYLTSPSVTGGFHYITMDCSPGFARGLFLEN
ncbi:MAG: hypothetical protein PHS43_05280 [Firmicutes bacterium]|nr:hypothetical protein [Bacillota bacterium]